MMERFWRELGGIVVRHPLRLMGACVVVIALLGIGLPRLDFVTDQATLVDSDSAVYRDNARFQDTFGGEPMLVLLTGDIRKMATGSTLAQLRALEDELRATGEFSAVVGPATALDFAVGQLGIAPTVIADADVREPATAGEREQLLGTETARLGAAGEHSLDNPAFSEFLLFSPDGSIRPGLRDNFLDSDHGLLLVRLKGNASIEEQAAGSALVRDIVAKYDISGVRMLASGPPELLAEINDYLQGGMTALGAMAIGVMVVLLLIVFRARWRLLPLGVVLIGAIGAFGAIGWAGISLTLVTISGLPILIGLGVDFAVQMHNRFEEELGDARPATAARRTYRWMAPPLTIAMVAAVAGFLALRRSPVPMIRDFGLLLVVGVVLLVAAAILMTIPVLFLREVHRPRNASPTGGWIEGVVRRICSLPANTVLPLLLVGAVVVVTGFAAEGGLPIQTDPDRWVDQQGTAVTDLKDLRKGTSFSSELSILVEAPDVTRPEVAAWIQRFGADAVRRHRGTLLRATSMASLATGIHGTTPGGNDIPALLSVAPDDASRALISPDHHAASIVFPIAPVSLDEREALLDDLSSSMHGELAPPPGVTATPAGLAVVGVELVNGLEAGRRMLSLTALAIVLVWLAAVYRSVTRAALVLVPVAIAVGLSSLAISALGIELTPLTTVAGPLIIAVCTEFSVLVVARYVEERELGRDPAASVTTGVVHIGRAFVASGLTLVGGFGVLAFSPMPLLRDFGIVVALDVLFALASTLVLLPPLLVWADQRAWVHGFRPGGLAAAVDTRSATASG